MSAGYEQLPELANLGVGRGGPWYAWTGDPRIHGEKFTLDAVAGVTGMAFRRFPRREALPPALPLVVAVHEWSADGAGGGRMREREKGPTRAEARAGWWQ
jgi:hypothetical protein